MAFFMLFFVGISIFSSVHSFECFGTFCSSNQYCLIQLHGSRTGSCSSPHGHGNHESHQQCVGSHHPGDHCFCLDANCVSIMEKNSGFTTMAPSTNMMMSSDMMGSTDSQETTTAQPAPTSTISVQFLKCFGNSCIAPLKVCKITFNQGVAASGTCEQPSTNLPDCGPTITNGDCQCKTVACMDTLYLCFGHISIYMTGDVCIAEEEKDSRRVQFHVNMLYVRMEM